MTIQSILFVVLLLLSAACSMVQPASAPLGSEQNPVKLALLPATETQKALTAGGTLSKLIEQETGLNVKISVPTSHAAVVEAMSTNNVDVGWLTPLGYLLAHERVGAEPLLAGARHGSTTSRGQIVVRADSGITAVNGLRGNRFAFADDESDAGAVLPRALLLVQGIDPDNAFASTVQADSRDRVMLAVYSRQVDGGAVSTGSSDGDAVTVTDGGIAGRPAPRDVQEQVRVIAQTDPVPNETLCLRQGVSPALARKISEGLLRVAASPSGAQALGDLYQLDGLGTVTDGDFAPLRAAVQALGLNLDTALATHHQTPAP